MTDETPAHQDREVLRELYLEAGLTQAEIGERLGVPTRTVAYWIKKHELDLGRGVTSPTVRRLVLMGPDEIGEAVPEGDDSWKQRYGRAETD